MHIPARLALEVPLIYSIPEKTVVALCRLPKTSCSSIDLSIRFQNVILRAISIDDSACPYKSPILVGGKKPIFVEVLTVASLPTSSALIAELCFAAASSIQSARRTNVITGIDDNVRHVVTPV